jgi:hypothetical protein
LAPAPLRSHLHLPHPNCHSGVRALATSNSLA